MTRRASNRGKNSNFGKPRIKYQVQAIFHNRLRQVPLMPERSELLINQRPNPSIEGTLSGLRPPSAPHVKR